MRLQTGRTTITFASADAHSHRITFPTPFAAVPVIVPNIDVAPAATARWDVRAINAATTGFTFFVYSNATGADTAWNNIQVSWLALSLTG
nr:H-type lectin domain-containing protein [Glycomyces amatae]